MWVSLEAVEGHALSLLSLYVLKKKKQTNNNNKKSLSPGDPTTLCSARRRDSLGASWRVSECKDKSVREGSSVKRQLKKAFKGFLLQISRALLL